MSPLNMSEVESSPKTSILPILITIASILSGTITWTLSPSGGHQ